MSNRAQRERDAHNHGLRRDTYNRVLHNCNGYWNRHVQSLRRTVMQHAAGKTVLELGSQSWRGWLDAQGIVPANLHCINISERELDKGAALAANASIQPRFHLMDAHYLRFGENSFDVVFGSGILHHLDLPQVLAEIARVLKPTGRIVFAEPLGINPVAKLVRLATPQARTADERPFGRADIKQLRKSFDIQLHPMQMFSVPLGLLSGVLTRRAENPLTYVGYKIDTAVSGLLPPAGLLYRKVLITGSPRAENKATSTDTLTSQAA